MSHLRIFLLLLGIVARQASAVNLWTLCRGQLSGTLLPNPHDCGTYYVCQSGPQLAYCGEGLHFDRVHKVCNWPERANCKLIAIEEQEPPSHSEVTIKEDSTQDESSEVIVKPNNPDLDLIQDESNEKIVKPDGTSDSGEKNLQQTIEEDSTQDEDTIQPEEELDVEQTSSAKPIPLPTSAEPDNKEIDSHELEGLILSSLSKDPSSDESAETGVASVEIDESVEKTPTHAIKLPLAVPGDKANVQISNSSKTSSSPPHNAVQFVQIPVSVLKPNQVQIEEEESVTPTKEPVNLSYEVFESSSLEGENTLENVKPTIEVHMPVKGTPSTIVNGSNINVQAEEKLVSSKPSHSVSHIIAVHVPVHNIEIPNSIVNGSSSNALTEVVEENAAPSKSSHNAVHVIEVHMPLHPIEVSNPIVNASISNGQVEGAMETVGPSKPSRNVTNAIEVHVPVHPIDSSIVNAHNRTAQAELIVEKVKGTKPTGTQVIELQAPALSVDAANSIELPGAVIEKVEFSNQLNQVIELPAPEYPADISNTIVNAIDTIPQAGVVAEKVDSDEPTRGSGQVIELSAPALPVEVSNAIVNAVDSVDAVYDFPQAGAVVEKVGSGKPTGGSGQVIELSAPALPVEVSNAIVNTVDAVNAVYDLPQAGAVVEKVSSGKPTGGSGQVIELPAGALPLVVSNAIANAVNAVNDLPQAEAVVEKVGSGKPTGGSGQVIELPAGALPLVVSNAIANAINAFPQGQAAVGSDKPSEVSNAISNTDSGVPQIEKVESGKPSSQVLDLPVPAHPAGISPAFAEHPAYAFQANSLESKKSSSEESANSESAEETVANVDSSEEDLALYLSSEEEQQKVDKSEESIDSSSLEDHQVISAADESSEEKIAEDAFDSQSLETEHLYQNQGKVDSSEGDQALTAAYESSEEKLDHQNNEESIEEIPHSPEEDKQTTDSISSSEQNSVKPSSYRPNKQRPSDVEKVKRPTKKPKPLGDRNVNKHSNSPTTVNSTNQQWNLTEAILSVAALEGITSANGTLIRPIVGAHDIQTGDPIDVMTDYNSKNVQCIHNGLYFLPHPSNCQKYFICAYRHLHLHSCGDNLIWNFKRERCELEFDSRCFSNEILVAEPKPGKATKPARDDKPDGTTAVTKGASTSTPMPPLRTTYPSTLAVTETFDEELPNCPSLRQDYLPSYDDCNKYYICILGHAVLTSCPDKLHWDAIGGFCGRPAKVRCASRVEKVSA